MATHLPAGISFTRVDANMSRGEKSGESTKVYAVPRISLAMLLFYNG